MIDIRSIIENGFSGLRIENHKYIITLLPDLLIRVFEKKYGYTKLLLKWHNNVRFDFKPVHCSVFEPCCSR